MSRASAVCSGVHATDGSRRPDTIALIDAKRRAQVVRHGTQERRADGVDVGERGGLGGFGGEASGCRSPTPTGRRAPAAVDGRRARATGRRARACARRRGRCRCPDDSVERGCRRRGHVAGHRDRSSTSRRRSASSRTPASPNVVLDLLDQSLHRLGIEREARRRSRRAPRPRAGPSRLERTSRRGVDQRTDGDGDGDEHQRARSRFSRLAIVNVVVRLDEEPVDEQRCQRSPPRRPRRRRRARRSPARRPSTSRSSVDSAIVVAERHGDGDQQRAARPAVSSHASDRAPPNRFDGAPAIDARRARHRRVRAMTCTSISGDEPGQRARRTIRAASSCQRLRRLAPSTIWVAFSWRAKAAMRLGGVVARRRRGPSRRARGPACAARRARRSFGLESPSLDRDVDADRVRRRRGRPCEPHGGSRASPLGKPGEPDHDTFAASPTRRRCRGRRGSWSATPRPGRRPTAGRVRAARRGCPVGSSWRARRRPARPGRCCRAPCVAGSPRAPCRRARSGRPCARRRRAPSRAAAMPVMREIDVVERLEVLDVERRDHVDAGVEQLLDVLPALLVARSGRVGVGVLVDEHDCGPAGAGPRRRPSRAAPCRGTSTSRRGITSRSSIWSAVCLRPCVSTTPMTTSVPRSLRRTPSPSIL